jgi:hypothetical protein
LLLGRKRGSSACEVHRSRDCGWRGVTGHRGAVAIECGGGSRAALRFFEPGDGALCRRRTIQGTPQLWSGPGRGQPEPAKGRNGAATGVELPSVSSSPATAALRFFEPGDGALRHRRTGQGTS